jgi:hypothetical protein
MTSSGRRIAFFVGMLIAFAIPKKIECGFPGGVCQHPGPSRSTCTPYEVEPWGFYLIEYIAGRNVGFAYSSDEECR